MITSIVPSDNGSVNPSSLLTISEAAKFAGVHKNTIFKHTQRGNLKPYRMGPGRAWNRYRREDIAKLFGIEIEENGHEEKCVAILARVSTEKQNKAGYLKSQIERLKKYVRAQYAELSQISG